MKKLIIVCETKCRVYGDYLAQLISLDDDTEESAVGTKDGEVAAQVWSEKDYTANASHISSDQYILFIGNDKLTKEKSTHMKTEFTKYGMAYGWLGKQAFLSVEKVVSARQYEEFICFAQAYQSDIEKLVDNRSKHKLLPEATKAGLLAGVVALTPLAAAVAASPVAGVYAAKKLTLNSKIKEQQYSCEVMKFYIDSLSRFLGI